ncbi:MULTISPECIES: WG repeat-containing protein [Myroides]|uniref:WG repeat-containing protein n=1 Tax=Myroides albus TaxID=2562892 RepID=A0A6I3LID5_9FLAO|nr:MULTISPECIES: WG repeat-containing protein [Myroides]MTG96930.1 WG repeat-containing protein [Myroides albus]MVX35377.1 WG repeat-containing protein [Myroides sp. LoEW2-1]UVD78319.1 WG repeat-containing protein [Myroides albus]
MKKIIAIGLFIGLYCNVSWAETIHAQLDIKSEITVKVDTVFIDLKNDPDFKFKNNLRWFQDSDLALFGIKKKTGELFMEPMFSQIESFVDNLSIVTFDDLQGAINNKGEIIIPFQYEELQTSSEGMIAFYENGLWGFFNTLGEVVIEPSFEYVGSFSDGLVLASKDNLFGYINKKGKIAIPFQYDYASNFEDGQAQVEVRFQSFIINKKGVKIAD